MLPPSPSRAPAGPDFGGGGDFTPAPQPQVIGVSPITHQPVASAQFSLASAASAGHSGWGIVGNLGRDALGILQGAPAAGGLLLENLGVVTGLNKLLPGSPSAAEVMHKNAQAAGAVVQDLRTRYGPTGSAIARGDVGGALNALGQTVYEHPLLTAVDVGTAWSGAGALTRLGARAVAAAGEGTALGERAAAVAHTGLEPTPRVPNPPRVRPPETLRSPLLRGEEHEAQAASHPAEATVTVKRPPLSKNPLTRGLIQRPAARVVARAQPTVQKLADDVGLKSLTEEGRFNRVMTRTIRQERSRAELQHGADVAHLTAAYNAAVRELKPIPGLAERTGAPRGVLEAAPHETDALALHLRGLLDVPNMTPLQARDTLLRRWHSEIATNRAKGAKTANAEATAARVAAIPDHMLDLRTAPPRLQAAVTEGRNLLDELEHRAVTAGVVTPETATASRVRAQNILLGGARWDPSLASTATRPVVRSRVLAGVGGREAEAVRVPLGRTREATVKGGFTPTRPGFEAGAQGRYITDVPVDKLTGQSKAGERISGRITPQPIHRSRGQLIQGGNISLSPHLPHVMARRTVTAAGAPVRLEHFIEQGAYRLPDGKLARGDKALQLMRTQHERVGLVSISSLRRGLAHLDELPDGQAADHALMHDVFRSAEGDTAEVRAANAASIVDQIRNSGRADDFVAVSKAALDEWRQAATSPGRFARKYDSALSLWKSGLLAFSPRWYWNNTIGNAQQFGLFAGPDVRTLWQALGKGKAGAYRGEGVIPPEAGATIAKEAGQTERIAAHEEALPRYKNITQRGFAFNNDLESFWRRATFLRAAKSQLRAQGDVRGGILRPYRLKDEATGKWRTANQQDMAERISQMPESMKQEAIRMTDRFMGDYRNFSPFERSIVKRVIPFYSWMRFIGSLTLGLPFRSPLRAQALHLLSIAGQVENPEDANLPGYLRGGIKIPGTNLRIPTNSMVPFRSVEQPISALTGQGSPIGALTGVVQAGSSMASPLLQAGVGEATGRNLFTGRDYSAPVGFGGSLTDQYGNVTRLNPATGQYEPYHPTPGLLEQLARSAPGATLLRSVLSGADRPYDVTGFTDLIAHALGGGPSRQQLFMPPSKYGSPSAPVPYLSGIASFLGIPIQRRDPAAEEAQAAIQQAAAIQAYVNTLRAQARQGARVGG